MKKQLSPEDIGDEELKELADRLEGESDRETLTNVLDWQDRNLSFWWERWPFDLPLKISMLLAGSLLSVVLFILSLLVYLSSPGLFLPFLAVVFGLVVLLIFSRTFLTMVIILISGFFTYRILSLFPPSFSLLYGGSLGVIALVLFYLFIRYRKFLNEDSRKAKFSKFIRMVNGTFRLTLPVSKFLEYNLAVCKDYAKITAALLFNLYPDSEIYFFSYRGHLAAGLKLDCEYYILDQRLPVSTKDIWLKRRGKEKADVHLLKLEGDEEEMTLIDKGKVILSEKSEEIVDTDELTRSVAKDMEIEQHTEGGSPDTEITMENHATFYDDDEIVQYSMIRAIKNKLSDEFSGNMDKVSRIEIEQDEEDLVLKVFKGK